MPGTFSQSLPTIDPQIHSGTQRSHGGGFCVVPWAIVFWVCQGGLGAYSGAWRCKGQYPVLRGILLMGALCSWHVGWGGCPGVATLPPGQPRWRAAARIGGPGTSATAQPSTTLRNPRGTPACPPPLPPHQSQAGRLTPAARTSACPAPHRHRVTTARNSERRASRGC